MASTGQSSSNQSLSGTNRASGATYGTGVATIASAAQRKKQLASALIQPSTDQVTIGGVSVTNSGVVGMASSVVRQLVPVVLERVTALGSAARNLLPGEALTRSAQTGTTSPGAFAQRLVSVSGGAGVTAAASAGATLASYKFTVAQTAAGQTSSSNGFVSTNPSIGGITGAGSLTIQIGTTTTTVTPTFSSATNAKEALEAVATAVNAAGIDAQAQVVSANGASRLQVTRKTTGAASTMTLGGGLAAPLGFSTTTAARDASYTLNGAAHTSSSNVIQLDAVSTAATSGRVQVNLTGATSTSVTVTVGVSRNDNVIVDAVKSLIDRFNIFRQTISSVGGLVTAGTQNQLDGALDALSNALRAIGVTADANGVLDLNEASLRSALKTSPARVEAAIGGASGLAARVYGVTSAIEKSPGVLFAADAAASVMPAGSQIAQANRLDLAMTKRLLDFQA
ncbi:MAG: flagellar filament capping protein FliD [Chloroflexi bacterium]|nr:flagellar filament capping protein FliD [Chloroflexota bacterium]